MVIKEDIAGDTMHITITGSIMGVDSAAQLEKKTEEWLHGDTTHFFLHLDQLVGMNSASIGRLIIFNNHLKSSDRTLKIVSCSQNLYSTLHLVKADALLDIEA